MQDFENESILPIGTSERVTCALRGCRGFAGSGETGQALPILLKGGPYEDKTTFDSPCFDSPLEDAMNCSWCSREIDPSKMNMHVDFHHPNQDITPMNLCRECTAFAVTGMGDAKILAVTICRTAKTLLDISDRIHAQEKN